MGRRQRDLQRQHHAPARHADLLHDRHPHEFISPLYNAILYKKALNIEYQSFKQEVSQTYLFHPYFLKQYNNRWYVFGLNDESGYILNLALDRITTVTETEKQYRNTEGQNFNEYFEDIVGVTLNTIEKVVQITLKVKNELYPYISTKPIHGSQKVKSKDASHTFITLSLVPNYELESLILSFGEGLEVIEPIYLRNKIKMRVKNTFLNYKIKSAD